MKRVLRGRRRVETDRFVALRSHYLFAGEFCVVGQEGAHEKGGIEGGLGRFRRNHLVPVPKAADFASLNRWLLDECARNDQRVPESQPKLVAVDVADRQRRRKTWEQNADRHALPEDTLVEVDVGGAPALRTMLGERPRPMAVAGRGR